MSTIHNPTKFIPENYQAMDVLDNEPPSAEEYIGGNIIELIKSARARYHADFANYFGWRDKEKTIATIPHKCAHCGTKIRYVVPAKHEPTGGMVAFGLICAERINLTLSQHRIKNVKETARKRADTIRLGSKYARFWNDNPDFAAAIEYAENNNIHNDFIYSIKDQLHQHGELSERQVSALINCVEKIKNNRAESAEKDKTRAKAVSGRHEITGDVISTKRQESNYGASYKALIEQVDGAKYWGTIPASILPENHEDLRMARVTLTATCKISKSDPHFAFYSRPTKASVL